VSPIYLALFGGLSAAGLTVALAVRHANAKARKGRPIGRSIPEAVERARRSKRRALVAFVTPGEAVSQRLLELLVEDEDMEARLKGLELVRVDSAPDDLAVTAQIAAKYGVESLVVPTILVLDGAAAKVGALEGKALGDSEAVIRERVVAFLGSVR
jgi:hypothetical protein